MTLTRTLLIAAASCGLLASCDERRGPTLLLGGNESALGAKLWAGETCIATMVKIATADADKEKGSAGVVARKGCDSPSSYGYPPLTLPRNTTSLKAVHPDGRVLVAQVSRSEGELYGRLDFDTSTFRVD